MTDESDAKLRTAFHEAGHAVLNDHFGHRIEYATVDSESDGQWSGQVKCELMPPEYLQGDHVIEPGRVPDQTQEQDAMALLGGFAVERILECDWELIREGKGIMDEPKWSHAWMDWARAGNICLTVFGGCPPWDRVTWAYLNWMLIRTQWFLVQPELWGRVDAVARELVVRERLEGAEVVRIIELAPPCSAPSKWPLRPGF